MDDEGLYALVRRHLLREAAFFAGAAPTSRALELPGVHGSIVAAAPDRSILNWVIYDRLDSLVGSHDAMSQRPTRGRACARGPSGQMPGDSSAAAEMIARGYKLDAEPLAMAARDVGAEDPHRATGPRLVA